MNDEMPKEVNTNPLPESKKEEIQLSKNRFVLKLRTKLPENPSYNDLVVWCLSRKNISISQKEFAELPVTVQAFFEIK